MLLFEVIFKYIGRRAAYHVLLNRPQNSIGTSLGPWSQQDIKELLSHTWERYATYKADIQPETTFGSQLGVRLAVLNICIYYILLERNIDKQDAIQTVSEINWFVYSKAMKLPKWFAVIVTRDRVKQMQFISRLIMTKFPFNPPGFQSNMLGSKRGGAFDVVRCPIIDQMRVILPDQDARNLTVTAWCMQDYPTAELWGGGLERSGTLADGSDQCDFHFVAH